MKELIEKIKPWRKYLPLLIGSVVVFTLLGFAESSHSRRYCKGLYVDILDEDDYQFVTKKDIQDIVSNHETEAIAGRNISSIKLRQIENRLLQNSFIRDAQAYLNLKSELHLKIRQRVPILRVLNEKNEQYYLDTEGKMMPLSENYTAKVPIATAIYFQQDNDSLKNVFNAKLFRFAQAIREDAFMESLCGQITVNNLHEFSVIPRLGKFEILMGDTSDLGNKFVRLKSFYKSTLPLAGWDKYSSISLKFKNQIIAITNNQ